MRYWHETAKRLAGHQRFEWQPGIALVLAEAT